MIYNDNIQLLIYRISLGKLIFEYQNQKYCFIHASPELKYEAELIYNSVIEENLFDPWIRKESIPMFLKKMDIWEEEDDKLLKQTEKKLENTKVLLYQNRLNKSKITNIKKDIENLKNNINKLFATKHSFDYITLEEYANGKKNEFLYVNSIRYLNTNKLVFNKNLNKVYYNHFIEITNEIMNYFITVEQYKKIARSEIWKTMWNGNKYNVFHRSAFELTDEQKSLLNISAMYDRIYEHPEAPEENIIEDDDMLEGWMIYQKRKSEESNKENKTQDILTKHGNAKEVYVVGDREDLDSIHSLNSTQSAQILNQRKQQILTSKEGVDEVNLLDVQNELLNRVNSRR